MKIVVLDEITVVGLPVRATWQELWTEMPRAWERFTTLYDDIGHPASTQFVDVSLEEVGGEYLQLVGRQVRRVNHIPRGMMAVVIPAHQYVHYRHEGPVKEIAVSFGRMYAWAREHGHEAGTLKLDSGYTASGDELEHDLYIALRPEAEWTEIKPA